ncbi:hypothetical protein IWX83_000936 [Flavobacterium sp. CG_9.1]|uniref:Uncharacterized protein n=1 Tax=Flavobacterium xanthum TaxID=69322 RepID=A0A1M7I0C8_9FLAO|nr:MULTISPECIES: hypothetical protein [Flavobacterium]MBG6061160.1 hypothetical protein [Flavobacterium sp. CG_9.1]SHM34099.1 hypothetical protein SAMN05443669_103127 [Flavobacterium xanthum]
MAIWALDTLPRRSEVLTTCKGFQSLGWSIPLRIHCSFVGMNPTNPWLLAISSAVAVLLQIVPRLILIWWKMISFCANF